MSEAAGRAAADAEVARWTQADLATRRFVSASYVTQPRGGRVDRTYLYERVATRIGDAPVRLAVRVTGDSARTPDGGTRATVLGVRQYAAIPEAFLRRYGEMRSANELLSSLTVPGMRLFLLAAVASLARLRDARRAAGGPRRIVGVVVGAARSSRRLDDIPGAWFDYDTATRAVDVRRAARPRRARSAASAPGCSSRRSSPPRRCSRAARFPRTTTGTRYWRHRGAPPIAARVLGGYALAALGFAYVTLFYLATRTPLGWWVPTGTLDDPNQIATPLPWVPARGVSRCSPACGRRRCSARCRSPRSRCGRADAPARARLDGGRRRRHGARLRLRPRELPVVARRTRAASSCSSRRRCGRCCTCASACRRRSSRTCCTTSRGSGSSRCTARRRPTARRSRSCSRAFLLPALAVAQGWLARRRALAAGRGRDAAAALRRLARRPGARSRTAEEARARRAPPPRRARAGARAALAGRRGAALAHARAWPRADAVRPATSPRRAPRVVAAADSRARARAAPTPRAWRRFARPRATRRTRRAPLPRAARSARDAARRARRVARDDVPAGRVVGGALRRAPRATVAERAEEWRVRVLPDGRVLDVTHVVPRGARRRRPAARRARAPSPPARSTLAGVPRAPLREVELEQTPRPARLDTRVEYEDTSGAPAWRRERARARVARRRRRHVGAPRRGAPRVVRARGARAREPPRARLHGRRLRRGRAPRRAPHARAPPRSAARARRALVDRRTSLALGAAGALARSARGRTRCRRCSRRGAPSEPWTTYLAQAALSAAMLAGVAGSALAAAWTLLDALRRRTAIPFWPDAPRDAGAQGAALGLGVAASQLVIARLSSAAWPAPRATALDAARTLGSTTRSACVTAALVAPTLAGLGLALVVAARRPAARWAALAAGAACVLSARGGGGRPSRALGGGRGRVVRGRRSDRALVRRRQRRVVGVRRARGRRRGGAPRRARAPRRRRTRSAPRSAW